MHEAEPQPARPTSAPVPRSYASHLCTPSVRHAAPMAAARAWASCSVHGPYHRSTPGSRCNEYRSPASSGPIGTRRNLLVIPAELIEESQ